MSDFEHELNRLCIEHCQRVRGEPAATSEALHIISSALAASIAALMFGNAEAAGVAAKCTVEALPVMVERRLHLFRLPAATAPSPGRAQ